MDRIESELAVSLPHDAILCSSPQPATLTQTLLTLQEPSSIRRLIETLILFLIFILFLRSFAVEPFGVPTGSMAPTLSGNHRCVSCPDCGFRTRIGEPSSITRGYSHSVCPNCGENNLPIDLVPDITGDRLLVDKNIYHLRNPRRWEVAVFRCPSDLTKPYVKRVVGLPGESIWIRDGDVWINNRLARKDWKQLNETRIPIFDMNYVPKRGWSDRFLPVESIIGTRTEDRPLTYLGWISNELRLDATQDNRSIHWLKYVHHGRDEKDGLMKPQVPRDTFAYNGNPVPHSFPIHDFLVEFDMEVIDGMGIFACQLYDGIDHMMVRFPIGINRPIQLHQEGAGLAASVEKNSLEPAKKYHIKLSAIDRRIYVTLNGDDLFGPFDLPESQRHEPVLSPVSFGVSGTSVLIKNLKIDRDIYYRSSGDHAAAKAYLLGDDEYFLLGDNSANSDDSRSWKIPAVPERNFLGKPFLLHQPSRISHLEIGPRQYVFPTIDWERIRWIR